MTIKPPETITVDKDADEVCCDGGSGALGHPVVWYSFDGADMVECGYCDRAFVRKGGKASSKSGEKSGSASAKAKKSTAKKAKAKKSAKKAAKKTAKKGSDDAKKRA